MEKQKESKNELIYLAKGKRSNVFLTEIIIKKNNKSKKIKAVIKKSISSLQHTESRIQHEANILKLLNKHKIGPKLYASKSIKENNQEINQLTEEYIEGIAIEKFLKIEKNKTKTENKNKQTNSKKILIKIIKQILNQCRTLDKLKINKEEMSNPYKHILLEPIRVASRRSEKARSQARDKRTTLKPVMIDFERARFTDSPANVTQFFQYLMHHKLVKLDEETKKLLKNYKTNQTEENYKRLLALL